MKRGIDHLVLCVSDLERAATFYRQLGFTTTPRAQHPWGTDNCLIQLPGCFLELLTVARPECIPAATAHHFSFGAYNWEFLSRRQGMSMLVFDSRDARADREEFSSRGLPPFETFHFARLATLPDGSQAQVAFTLAFAVDPGMPEATFFCCQQHAPQYFWRAEYQVHANGATAIDEVFMVAEKPSALADFFAKVQERDCVARNGDRLLVRTPRGVITVLTPEEAGDRFSRLNLAGFPASPYFLGFAVRVPDADRVVAQLCSIGAPFEAAIGSVHIGPQEAFGVLMEFHSRAGIDS
jgi:catechol 2,3-dioxygenase-like lactoylglutathione lyase family enzyme